PVISPGGGPFTPPLAVTLASALSDSIRYTLDGTEPTPASPLYADPIPIQRSTVLKAKAFGRGLFPSGTSNATFIDSLAPPETTVTGRIVDRNGTARAGAHVACGAVSGETDASGRFEL